MSSDDLTATGSARLADEPAASADSGHVVLLGLPRTYAAALGMALAAVGLEPTVTDELEQLPAVLAVPDLTAVVAAESTTALLLASTGPWTAMAAVVVLVLARARPQDCAAALQQGATGLITPDADPRDAALAVQLAVRRQTVLPRELLVALSRPSGPPPPVLSAVDREWLRALAAGDTVAQLTQRHGSTEGQTYRQLSALYARMGAANRTDALLAAHQHGLLTEPA